MLKVLIVEDEKSLAETIAYNLQAEGYKVCLAMDGLSAIDMLRNEKPDLALLDIMLPNVDGLEVCRLIRKESEIPIIMLTAKSREIDKVVGLEVGADDYVTKPFGMLELIARVRAALRRAKHQQSAQSGEILNGNGISLDIDKRSATIDGQEIELRRKEFDLLHILMSNRGRVFERSTLLNSVWGEDEYIDQGTVDVHIRRLREKIEMNPSKPERIITVRGVGYKFAD